MVGPSNFWHRRVSGVSGPKLPRNTTSALTPVGLYILQGFQRVGLVLHRHGALIQALAVGGHDVLAALGGQGDGEAVAETATMPSFTSGIFIAGFSFPCLQQVGNVDVLARSGPHRPRRRLRRNPDGPAATCCRPAAAGPPRSAGGCPAFRCWCPRAAHQHPEALGRVGVAGGVVQGGGVYLHQHPAGTRNAFTLPVSSMRFQSPLPGQQQDKVLGAQVELAVPVVLQAVQFVLRPLHQPICTGIPP